MKVHTAGLLPNFSEMKLYPSEVWSVVIGCDTFENFQKKMVPVFSTHEAIPEMIKRRLLVIQKLILHSYYEYEFIDVALLQAFQTLELALHLKYKLLYPERHGLKNLKPYLDWAVRENIIPPDINPKEIGNLRNHVAHLKEDSMLGMVGLNVIKFIMCDLIPGLFHK
jgi:hypothetical protein